MITIAIIKKEYFRIEKLLNKTALTGTQYDAKCKTGMSIYIIKRDLGLSWNKLKKKIGAKEASSSNTKGGTGRNKKIYCSRGAGRMIGVKDCVPGCNDACQGCESKQLKNAKAGGEAVLTVEIM